MSVENNIPVDTTDAIVDSDAVDTGSDDFDADYYGDISSDEVEVEHADGSSDSDDSDKSESFIQDGVDLSHIPEELRGETLQDTIKNIDEARSSANREKDITKTNLDNMRKNLGIDENQDSFVVQYQRNLQAVDNEARSLVANEKARLQNLVDTNQMSEAEANLQYGQFKKEVDMQKEAYLQESHSATNLAIVENFIKQNEEVLKNPLIAEAAETLIRDVITDGNIVSTERSMNYLTLGKKLYDEGYKQGLAATQQVDANKQVQGVKKQVQNPQVTRGGTPPKPSGIPYATAADVPQHVWNKDAKIRNYFLSKDAFPLL